MLTTGAVATNKFLEVIDNTQSSSEAGYSPQIELNLLNSAGVVATDGGNGLSILPFAWGAAANSLAQTDSGGNIGASGFYSYSTPFYVDVFPTEIVFGNSSANNITHLNQGNAIGANTLITLPTVSSTLPGVVTYANPQTLTGANTNILTTTSSGTHTYRVGGYLDVTAITAGTLTMQVTFTDENSTSRTLSFFAPGSTTANVTATGFVGYPAINIRVNGTATVKTTFTGTSTTYDAGAYFELVN